MESEKNKIFKHLPSNLQHTYTHKDREAVTLFYGKNMYIMKDATCQTKEEKEESLANII